MIDQVAQRRDAKVAAIVEAAWRLAREHGVAGVSLHGLAREVGMRQPSLYDYFDSKQALYDAMFADGNRQLLERLDATSFPRDPRAALKKFMARSSRSRSRIRRGASCSSSGTYLASPRHRVLRARRGSVRTRLTSWSTKQASPIRATSTASSPSSPASWKRNSATTPAATAGHATSTVSSISTSTTPSKGEDS